LMNSAPAPKGAEHLSTSSFAEFHSRRTGGGQTFAPFLAKEMAVSTGRYRFQGTTGDEKRTEFMRVFRPLGAAQCMDVHPFHPNTMGRTVVVLSSLSRC